MGSRPVEAGRLSLISIDKFSKLFTRGEMNQYQ